MKLIRTITEEDFGRIPNPSAWADFKDRLGARAVLFDNQHRVALMHVANRNYYKLPGVEVSTKEKA